jgi:hypothetical protein
LARAAAGCPRSRGGGAAAQQQQQGPRSQGSWSVTDVGLLRGALRSVVAALVLQLRMQSLLARRSLALVPRGARRFGGHADSAEITK